METRAHLAQVNIARMKGIPSIDEAKKRLARLSEQGPTPYAFTFKTVFPPDDALIAATDWSAFEPCPAM